MSQLTQRIELSYIIKNCDEIIGNFANTRPVTCASIIP